MWTSIHRIPHQEIVRVEVHTSESCQLGKALITVLIFFYCEFRPCKLVIWCSFLACYKYSWIMSIFTLYWEYYYITEVTYKI